MTDDTTAEKADKKDQKAIIKMAVDCLEDYQERENDNIKRAEEAIEFRSGKQWPDAIKRDREQDGRPCPVFDKINQYVRQIVNEERQTKAAIRVRPVDDKADPKVAEIYNGIIRHIEDASDATTAYTTAGEHAIDGGFGYWRILTEYCDPKSFDQDIRIKRIPNRFSVALGHHNELDGSDAREALIWEDMPRDQFKAKYPKAKLKDFESDSWADDDNIRVAEYMRIVDKKATIYLMPDESIWTDAELKEIGVSPDKAIASRETVIPTVKWYKLTGAEVLEERDMLGSFIPVIKVTGNELIMKDGTKRLSGMVEQAMDPARLHNYAQASFIEKVALAPKAPWTAPQDAIKGFESDYEDANRRNIGVLKYNHLDEQGNPLPPPSRTPPTALESGWAQISRETEHAIDSSLGMYGPSVGAKSQEKSGIALQEQKQQGMVGNFHFPDNLAKSIRHTGRIIVEWIPYVYDTQRVARIIGEDGNELMAYLNPEQEAPVMPRMDQMGQEVGKSYNLNVGKYDVTVTTGPSYTSLRQETVANNLELVKARPDMLNIVGDQLYANMDFPGADKIARRFKLMLPPQIQEAEAEGEEDQNERKANELKQAQVSLTQQAQALFQKEQELTQMEAALNERGQETSKERAELEKLRAEIKVMNANLDADQAKLEATRKVFSAEVKTASIHQKMMGAMNQQEEGEKQPVQVFDSKMADPITQMATSFQMMAEAMERNSNVLMALAQNMSMPKRVVLDEQGNPIGIEPVRLN